MKQDHQPERLDVRSFSQDAARLVGDEPLSRFERLAAEVPAGADARRVQWSANGEWRVPRGGHGEAWLHLAAQAQLPMICQRCLGPLEATLEVERSFRFVADEATAAEEDDEAEEDLLVLSRSFDLIELVEDELLMAMPVVPRHAECPTAVTLAVADEGFDAPTADKPNPFAALKGLKTDKRN